VANLFRLTLDAGKDESTSRRKTLTQNFARA
jgi:hypothetical protein